MEKCPQNIAPLNGIKLENYSIALFTRVNLQKKQHMIHGLMDQQHQNLVQTLKIQHLQSQTKTKTPFQQQQTYQDSTSFSQSNIPLTGAFTVTCRPAVQTGITRFCCIVSCAGVYHIPRENDWPMLLLLLLNWLIFLLVSGAVTRKISA